MTPPPFIPPIIVVDMLEGARQVLLAGERPAALELVNGAYVKLVAAAERHAKVLDRSTQSPFSAPGELVRGTRLVWRDGAGRRAHVTWLGARRIREGSCAGPVAGVSATARTKPSASRRARRSVPGREHKGVRATNCVIGARLHDLPTVSAPSRWPRVEKARPI
jgi:hypothetical protein